MTGNAVVAYPAMLAHAEHEELQANVDFFIVEANGHTPAGVVTDIEPQSYFDQDGNEWAKGVKPTAILEIKTTGIATRGNSVAFGDFGLKSTDRGRLTARQIESARRAISRHVKRGGRIWIRVFPDKPISNKPAEVRMGNGKGNPEYWVAEIQPGKVLYEMDGVNEVTAKEAFRLAAAKLPIATTFVQRQVGG